MTKRFTYVATVLLLWMACGCSTVADDNIVKEETKPVIPMLDSIEYWDIVQDEIVSMLNSHNLYVSATSHGYPCVQFYVEPGIVTDDGKILASGLSQAEYEELFECIKAELHSILDKYILAKPKTAFHGCHSNVDIFLNNWFVDENKIYDNVYSRDVACYGLDLLEYYHEREGNSYIQRDAFFTDVWSKYPIYKP